MVGAGLGAFPLLDGGFSAFPLLDRMICVGFGGFVLHPCVLVCLPHWLFICVVSVAVRVCACLRCYVFC